MREKSVVGKTPTTYEHRRANRQYVAMTDREVWRFLDSRDRIFVAFPTRGGYPHVTPVWFCVIDKKIYIRTHDYKVKAKLAGYGKACLSIDDGKVYRELRGVTIWGRSSEVTEEGTIRRVSRDLDAKYRREQWRPSKMPKWWVQERERERRTYIEILPEKVSSWDNAKVV